jgi:DNA-binding transcriptional ArsR family regulator
VTKARVRLDLSATDLGRVRFAISPLSQLVGALIVLGGRRVPAGLAGWRELQLPRLTAARRADPLLALIVDLLAVTTYVPDCLSPPPSRRVARLSAELELIRATPAPRLRDDLRRSAARRRAGTPAPPPRAADGAGLPDALARTLSSAWEQWIGAAWPAVRAVLEGDIAHRGRTLSDHGLASTLRELDASARLDGDGRLELADRSGDSHRPDGVGLWLVPNAFDGGWLCLAPPTGYALTYPARGTAALFDADPATAAATAGSVELARLIGAARARILRRLREPATTTQLAAELRMTPGAVGDHLAVLRGNRLVTRRRAGRSVIYSHTDLARALLADSETAARGAIPTRRAAPGGSC